MKYQILLKILDQIRLEAKENYRNLYVPAEAEVEALNYARSRAFIHLYLKVLFGLLDFNERERLITEGSYDGGIDGYYIDQSTKQIYLIQSKFRTNEKNFENKTIQLEEILQMDVTRILDGEECDEQGNQYRGKIKQLQREVSQLSDVARYNYKVVLLANLREISPAKLRILTGGYAVEVFDFEKSYERLVFPVITGTYFTASDISIPIDLSSKNAGSKISYTVKTKIGDCEITVLFAPTIEIAKIMHKYKNSILKYNPRSYLDLEGQSVNNSIRSTILQTDTNEFALYNNGITMLSDETYINERIGQKNKAQLTVKNPQIINGGQTSFTLSRIYDEKQNSNPEAVFKDKEVLLKIITLIDNNSQENKLRLIDEISNATNKQTPVINADKFANEIAHQKIQRFVFDEYGLLYERKRGEFFDGIKSGYIDGSAVIERNLFLRILYAANGQIKKGTQKKLFQKNDLSDFNLDNKFLFNRFFIGFMVFGELTKDRNKKKVGILTYAKVYAYVESFLHEGTEIGSVRIKENLKWINSMWTQFMETKVKAIGKWHKKSINLESGDLTYRFLEQQYVNSHQFPIDLSEFFAHASQNLQEQQPKIGALP